METGKLGSKIGFLTRLKMGNHGCSVRIACLGGKGTWNRTFQVVYTVGQQRAREHFEARERVHPLDALNCEIVFFSFCFRVFIFFFLWILRTESTESSGHVWITACVLFLLFFGFISWHFSLFFIVSALLPLSPFFLLRLPSVGTFIICHSSQARGPGRES